MDPDELLETACQLVEQGAKKGLTLRILGHLSVRQHSSDTNRQLIDMLKRVPTHDIDFMGYSKQTGLANKMFIDELGFKPDPAVAFSQEYGIQRLIYYHDNGIMAEIFLDQLRMAHTLDFRGRLELDSPTISLVDILLSKLQIVQITEKDFKDLIVLLAEHDLGSNNRELVDVDYLLKLTKDDWGLYYTAYTNLGKVKDYLKTCDVLETEIKQRVDARLDVIMKRMVSEPKSLRWKARAKIGTRVKWYEDVGDVHRDGE
jgi:hypothetical protein